MNVVRLGPLQAVIVPPPDPQNVERTVILAHGYGAPGTDLVGLAKAISAPKGTRYVFVQAPHTIEGMTGPHAGRAWWHIDMMALHIARMTGEHDELAAQIPEGLSEARQALDDALLVLERDHELRWEATYLGGFSQGAMLTMDYALRSERPLRGVLQLSGTVICEAEWLPLMKKRAGLRVFQSHSPDDPVLPFSLAERLHRDMTEAGMKATFVSFRGGHGIGPEVLEGISAFLREDAEI